MGEIIQLADKVKFLTPQVPLFLMLQSCGVVTVSGSTFTWEDHDKVTHENNTQIFKKSIPLNYDKYDFQSDRTYQRKQRVIDIAKDIERAILFGHKDDSGFFKTMGGLNYFLPHIIHNKSFVNSEKNMENFCRRMYLLTQRPSIYVLSHISNIKLMVAELWGQPNIKHDNISNYYKIPISYYISPHLSLYFIESIFLKENELFVIQDIADLQLVQFAKRGLYLESDIHYRDANDTPRDKDELLCEYGLKIFDMKHNFYVTLE